MQHSRIIGNNQVELVPLQEGAVGLSLRWVTPGGLVAFPGTSSPTICRIICAAVVPATASAPPVFTVTRNATYRRAAVNYLPPHPNEFTPQMHHESSKLWQQRSDEEKQLYALISMLSLSIFFLLFIFSS